jgi:hypothetical protein
MPPKRKRAATKAPAEEKKKEVIKMELKKLTKTNLNCNLFVRFEPAYSKIITVFYQLNKTIN